MNEDEAANNLTTQFISVPIRVIHGKKTNRGWTLIYADKKEKQTTDINASGLERFRERSTTETRRTRRVFTRSFVPSVSQW